jgi:hypothetical protein
VKSSLDNAYIGDLNIQNLGLIIEVHYKCILLLIIDESFIIIILLILHVLVLHVVLIIAKESISLLAKVNTLLLSLLEMSLEIAKVLHHLGNLGL